MPTVHLAQNASERVESSVAGAVKPNINARNVIISGAKNRLRKRKTVLKRGRLFSVILGVALIVVSVFFSLLYVGLTLEFGLFLGWLYLMATFLGIMVGFAFAIGKSFKKGVKAWLLLVAATSLGFLGLIVVLPTVYQVLSVTVVAIALLVGFYYLRKYARAHAHYQKRHQT